LLRASEQFGYAMVSIHYENCTEKMSGKVKSRKASVSIELVHKDKGEIWEI
jgi:hypothetical protein